MPSISVEENIKGLEENLKRLVIQRNDISSEILRMEGALQVFNDMKKNGVTNIEINDPINSEEVIDVRGGSP
jgi:hypothetical protein